MTQCEEKRHRKCSYGINKAVVGTGVCRGAGGRVHVREQHVPGRYRFSSRCIAVREKEGARTRRDGGTERGRGEKPAVGQRGFGSEHGVATATTAAMVVGSGQRGGGAAERVAEWAAPAGGRGDRRQEGG